MQAPRRRTIEFVLFRVIVAGVALAAPRTALAADEPATGPLFRADAAASSAIVYQSSSFSATTGQAFHFEDVIWMPGSMLAVNLGYSYDANYRVGLSGAAQFGVTLAGGDGMPFTTIEGMFRVQLGPTLGLRLPSPWPLEVEIGLAYVRQDLVGSQLSIGSPENGYPLGEPQQGALASALLIWRPLGVRSILGIAGGVDTSWIFVEVPRGTTHGVTTSARLGVSIGL